MVRECANCAGPEDVRREFRKKIELPCRELLVLEHREYVRLQASIIIIIERDDGDDELQVVPPPPCVKCPVDVLHYCMVSGTECKKFRLYASGPKGGRRAEDRDNNDGSED